MRIRVTDPYYVVLLCVLWTSLAACSSPSSPPLEPDMTGPNDMEIDAAMQTPDVDSRPESWQFGSDTVTVAWDENEGLRTYELTTTHSLRDQAPKTRRIVEKDGDPLLRSGVLLTDAVFAMAVDDLRQNAVSTIRDGAFAQAESCECYQTGEKWNWVWTRDIAYATELGLALSLIHI